MYSNDKRIILTLDAGGTNLVFSAIAGDKEIVTPFGLASSPDNLDHMLDTIVSGFRKVSESLPSPASAISFAFPGPADYPNGVIGDLPNMPAFRGGIALGPFLRKKFGIPVFINNDGSLFALGEAQSGILPEINESLKAAGSPNRYHNLIGVTFGTGFGAGVVINGEMLSGDNSCGGYVWTNRNKLFPEMLCEESVSVRGIKRAYSELSGDTRPDLTPKDICEIADGKREGDKAAAAESFRQMGVVAGDVIAQANMLVDGIVVIGGGLAGARKHFMPALMKELRGDSRTFSGEVFPRYSAYPYDLTDENERIEFFADTSAKVPVPHTDEKATYNSKRRTAVCLSSLGASKAIALGAYAFALSRLDKQ